MKTIWGQMKEIDKGVEEASKVIIDKNFLIKGWKRICEYKQNAETKPFKITCYNDKQVERAKEFLKENGYVHIKNGRYEK